MWGAPVRDVACRSAIAATREGVAGWGLCCGCGFVNGIRQREVILGGWDCGHCEGPPGG